MLSCPGSAPLPESRAEQLCFLCAFLTLVLLQHFPPALKHPLVPSMAAWSLIPLAFCRCVGSRILRPSAVGLCGAPPCCRGRFPGLQPPPNPHWRGRYPQLSGMKRGGSGIAPFTTHRNIHLLPLGSLSKDCGWKHLFKANLCRT